MSASNHCKERPMLRRTVAEDRVVVSHDHDFGTLAVLAGEPIIGIVYLRPGHIDPTFTKATIQVILQTNPDISAPFILVAQRKALHVTMRVRSL
jgi:predicted nuclease of predicted toxin-antitoxin system